MNASTQKTAAAPGAFGSSPKTPSMVAQTAKMKQMDKAHAHGAVRRLFGALFRVALLIDGNGVLITRVVLGCRAVPNETPMGIGLTRVLVASDAAQPLAP